MLVVVLAGCEITGDVVSKKVILEHNDKEIGVYFCPGECEEKLVDLIDSASKYVHCAFFDLDLEKVIIKLAAKSSKIDVKVVVDNENSKGLKGDGFRFDSSSQYSHNKFCVVDGERISSGSFNPTLRGAYKNNNNLVLIDSKTLASNYEEEFQELWNGTFGEGNPVSNPVIYLDNVKIKNYFCPEDGCSSKIINILNGASESIYFMTFAFTHRGIADAILFKELNGVKVEGLFEKSQSGSKYSQFKRMYDLGLNVSQDKNPANMHHKVFIVDKSIVITGSFNPSNNADKNNDENVLVIYSKEIAKKYLEEFDKLTKSR